MSDLTYPSRRTRNGEILDRRFIEILEAMLQEDETVTARAVVRRLEGVDHASSITRDPWRKARIADWQARQLEIRALARRVDKRSKANIAADLEKKEARIRELETQINLLCASHRVMIRAVGELGGMQAWMRFYADCQPYLNRLRQLGALPEEPPALLRDANEDRPG